MCLTCKELGKRLGWYDFPIKLVSAFHKSARFPNATYICVQSQPRWSNKTLREFKEWLTDNGFARSARFPRKGVFAYGKVQYMIQVILTFKSFLCLFFLSFLNLSVVRKWAI
jgi:hypothetical protein